ncbi:MAG: bifunctional acetate--CoA ligase family protein/GNAT family N-acetyltransferase [Candidatus Electrothrix aestuarii]|uniref:Bifunctional acetate--CoA ligase family protein/GNAT family N-acetyltransferase n=1 Tax=Candidatus Electrothrix aestuarii TaxID=3062594 RepID=A0AAU8LXJ4_9BACT|nr:bifunctional acetate--CoA ligase family protein/GNAT family N-acetyltransferase [Candidatus Electrothrix aestuarii]
MGKHYLNKLFEPDAVAVFGASDREGAVGALVFKNMIEGGFKGDVFPVNPKHKKVQGRKAYPDLKSIGKPVDLAVITTPAATVPGIVEECGVYGIKDAVVISAGFREVGPRGLKLERAVVENARRYGMRIMGPNCLGLMRPSTGLNCTFNKGTASEGSIALVSQSGALCTAILDWAAANGIGFSSVVSTGISADIDFGDILDYLVNDPKTKSILLYIEGIHNALSFMSGLRAAARIKPVIALKVGRHATGSKAAMSHTGALVGSDDVFDSALRRAGVLRGIRIANLFSAAGTLTFPIKASGEHLAIITNGGGPGVMATDRLADLGLPLAELSEATMKKLDAVLPATWSKGNPVDIIGDATPERYTQAVEICLKDPGVDGLLVLLTPQAMTDPAAVAQSLVGLKTKGKPLLTCWMGEIQVAEGRRIFRDADVPTFNTPETAVDAFSYLVNYSRNQKLLLETPGPISRGKVPDVEGARLIIESVLGEGRKVLSEAESKAVLHAFRIPTASASIVRSPNEALVQAETIGFPIALKINSPDITHKSDAGGVRLGISNAQAARSAYNEMLEEVKKNRPEARIDGVTIEPMLLRPNGRELLVGLVTDPVFGPVITFGAGGTAVEVMGDRAVTLPPLNRRLVQDVISRTRVSKLLGAFRHMPAVDIEALEQILLRVSEIACELPMVKELDINPLIVDENGAIAVDARIVVDYHVQTGDRYSHMAIYPYPAHLVTKRQLPNGRDMVIRPIRPEDAEIEQAFVRNLSEQARYFRFMQSLTELSPQMLTSFTQIDYNREMALIAVVEEDGKEVEIGVARYIINPDGRSCEFAIVISDQWQRQGIAHLLMRHLIDTARSHGMQTMEGDVLRNNNEMLRLVTKLGFSISPVRVDPDLEHVILRM